MSDQTGSVTKTFRAHVVIEMALVAALALYLGLVQEKPVGEELGYTVAGAGLMALVTYWTLTTLRDGLELLVARTRRLQH